MQAQGDGNAVQLTLEIIRSSQAADPFAFAAGLQEYILRTPLGGAESLRLDWDAALLSDLAALRRPGRDPALPPRIGDLLRDFMSTTWFAAREDELLAALARGEAVQITLRLAAAELFALPWELLTLSGSGLHLGAQPGVILRYAWPDTRSLPWPKGSTDTAGPAASEDHSPEGGRLLFAWSAAAGQVPVHEHVQALCTACQQAGLSFDDAHDVLPHASLSRLVAALSRLTQDTPRKAVVLHVLCHGARKDGSFGLGLDADDDRGLQIVDAGALRQALFPFAAQLRLVVLSACDSGNSGALGNHLGSVAQALHRAGIASVIASRYPLSAAGSVTLTQTLYAVLLGRPASLEVAFDAARAALLSDADSLDWAALQLFARPEDGDDTRPLPFRPYRGLTPFSSQHSRFFFGRDAERRHALHSLRQLIQRGRPRFLVVTGASGTGKSSVVLAGLLPDLLGIQAGDPPDSRLQRTASELLQLLPTTPQPGQTETLRAALHTLQHELLLLSQTDSAAPWECAVLRPGSDPRGALQMALSRRRDPTRPFVLVVDQLEELFTHETNAAARSEFTQRLWALCQGPQAISCVVTLRVDFLGRCGELALDTSGLFLDRIAYDEAHRVFVAQPGPDQLAAAIVQPARRVGLHIAPSLVSRLVSEVVGEPGALPLLSYVLDLLWQRRNGRELTEDAYSRLGGVAGALGASADRLFDALSVDDQRLARQILVRLVGFSAEAGGETRLRRSVADLQSQLPSAGPRLPNVLQVFVEARLLVRSEDDTQAVVEVAHEALIRRWERLQGFLRGDRQRLLEVRELSQWATQFGAFGTLLRGSQLGYAQRLVDKYSDELGDAEKTLVRDSRRAQRRRLWRTGLALSLVLVALSGLSLHAQRSAQQARREQRQAQQKERTAQARLLSYHAEQATDAKPATALLLSTHALQLQREPSTQSALFGALQRTSLIRRFVALPQSTERAATSSAEHASVDRVHSLAFTRDSRFVLAAAGTTGLVIVDASDGRVLAQHHPQLDSGRPAALYAAVPSPDGKVAVAAGEGGQIHSFPLVSGGAAQPRIGTTARTLYSLDYRPDGLQIAAGTGDGDVLLIDPQRLRQSERIATGTPQIVAAVAYEPAGTRLAAVGNSGSLVLIETRRDSVDPAATLPAAAHPDAPAAASIAGADRPRSPLHLGPLPAGHGYLSSVAWLAGGRQLAAASEDGGVRFWDSQRGESLSLLTRSSVAATAARTGALSAVSASSDGQILAACGLDGRLWLHALGPRPDSEPPLQSPDGAVYSCALSPDGQTLATGGDGQIILWNLADHPLWHRRRSPLPTSAIAASPDGRTLYLGDVEGAVSRWPLSQDKPDPAQPIHSRAITALTASPDGGLLLAGGSDGRIAVLQTPDLRQRPTWLVLSSPHRAVTALAVHPSGKTLTAGYADGALARFDLPGQTPGQTPGRSLASAVSSQQQAVTALVFSADGTRLFSSGLDGSLRVFAGESGQPLCAATIGASPSAAHRDAVTGLALRRAGDRLASSGRDGRILLWSVPTAAPTASPIPPPCPTLLADLQTPHRGAVTSLAFSSDGERLASAGEDAQIWIWDVDRRQTLGRPLGGHRRAVHSLTFSAHDALFSADDETVFRWDVHEPAWTSQACARAGRNLSLSDWQQALGDVPYCRVCPQHASGAGAPIDAPACPAAPSDPLR